MFDIFHCLHKPSDILQRYMGQMLYKKAKLQRYAGWPDFGYL